MGSVEGREPALAALGQPLPAPIADPRRERTPGQLIPPYELALADPGQGIRPPRREPYARARGLSAEEVARLLAAIPVESAAGLRLRALVLAYLLTGRRRSEVLNLRWRDMDLEGGFYRYTGKGRQGAAASIAASGPPSDPRLCRGGRPGQASRGGGLPRSLA